MTRIEAADMLLQIIEAMEDAGADCGECPFRYLHDDFDNCPFMECPAFWDLEHIERYARAWRI